MLEQRIIEIINERIRPALQAHQGDIALVKVSSEGIVTVRLTGACATCPGAQQTLAGIVETELRQACPEITGVTAVYQASNELLAQALRLLRKEKNVQ